MDTIIYSINSQFGQQLKEFLLNPELEGDVVIDGTLTVPLIKTAVGSLTLNPQNGVINVLGFGVFTCDSIACNQILRQDLSTDPISIGQGVFYLKDGQSYGGAPLAIYNFSVPANNGSCTWGIGSLTINAGASVIVNITIPTFLIDRKMMYLLEGSETALGSLSVVSTGNTTNTFTCRITNFSGSNYTNAQLVELNFMTY